MGKNEILQFSDDTAMVEYIKKLRGMLEELKAQQAPSIGLVAASTVDFSTTAFNRTTNKAGNSTFAILMTLNPAVNERIFAIPEVDLFGHPTTPAIDGDSLYPTGANWELSGNSSSFYDLDVWYDLWNNDAMSKQAATAFIRSRGPNAMTCKFVVRWRSIMPGSN